jgi:hypothetical protein
MADDALHKPGYPSPSVLIVPSLFSGESQNQLRLSVQRVGSFEIAANTSNEMLTINILAEASALYPGQ